MKHEIKKVVIECDNSSKITDASYTFWYQDNPDETSSKEAHEGVTKKALDVFEYWAQFSIRLFNDIERAGAPSTKFPAGIESVPPPRTIAEWVKLALSVHKLEDWPLVTGVSPRKVQSWANGEELPSSRDLWDLLTITHRYHPRIAADFDLLADQPFEEVIGNLPLPSNFRTLKDYAMAWRLEELKGFMLCLPFRQAHELAEIFVAASTREILRKGKLEE